VITNTTTDTPTITNIDWRSRLIKYAVILTTPFQ